MFKRILVPLDGSPRAERAISVAARLARASSGSVVLLRVVNMPVEFWPSSVSEPNMAQTIVDTDQASTKKYLAGITTTPALDGVPTETVVLFGQPAWTILAVAHSSHADLIVLCSHDSAIR